MQNYGRQLTSYMLSGETRILSFHLLKKIVQDNLIFTASKSIPEYKQGLVATELC